MKNKGIDLTTMILFLQPIKDSCKKKAMQIKGKTIVASLFCIGNKK